MLVSFFLRRRVVVVVTLSSTDCVLSPLLSFLFLFLLFFLFLFFFVFLFFVFAGTPTEIQTDLPCAQDCPGDCEHAEECDGFNLRYWVPIFHKEAWTTDRIYNWVTPKTGQNHQWELNEANSLGHPVPKDESGQATAARDCYLSCVKTCASKCFYALQRLPDTERNKVVEIQKLAKRLPGITGNQINDENLETSLQKQGTLFGFFIFYFLLGECVCFSLTFSPPPLSSSFVSDFLHTIQHTQHTQHT